MVDNIFGEIIIKNPTIYNDLEIFHSHDGTVIDSIFNKLDKTFTSFGCYQFKSLLSDHTSNIYILNGRQAKIRLIKNHYPVLKEMFQELKEYEKNVLELWDELSEEMQSFYDIVYFNFPFEFANKICNKNELLLQTSNLYNIWLAPLFNVAIPLLTIVIPYIIYFIMKYILRYDLPNIPISTIVISILKYMLSSYIGNNAFSNTKYMLIVGAIIWCSFYCINSYQSIKSAYDTYININLLHHKVNSIKKVINIANQCLSIFPTDDSILHDNITFFNTLLSDSIFDTNPHILSNKGKILYTYKVITESKEKLIPILKYVGLIESYFSIYSLIQDDGYTFTNYLSNRKTPAFHAVSIWHPSIQKKNIVYNTVKLSRKTGNYLITGPNKAGKSTYIKSVAVAVLLSQTIGIVNAKKAYLTPYEMINTHLHIPDKTGYESLFEAELKRASNELKELEKGKFVFIIMDEILTSTNYVEGYAAAYAIAKKMSMYNNANIMITTHYTGLSRLEKETEGKIKNYHFGLVNDKYNYKLTLGVSNQFVALELLNKEFNETGTIVEDANRIANDLQKEKVSLNI